MDARRARRIYFPFTAIVGMEKAKTALLAAAVDPGIGGVLLVGDKGTGKTTLVRSLAQVLPEIPVVKGCPYGCNPFDPREMCDTHYEAWLRGEKPEIEWRPMRVIDLPLSISVDRLVGSIDVEAALREGRVVFKPGLLAEANRNILYIDEVNLLDDYIADIILDAAATGWNTVEREGFSVRHPARFILVGSMNPEEGELRPQLLDRFGLYVEVMASQDPEERMLIVERVEEFHRDPIGFMKRFEESEEKLRQRIIRARELLSRVEMPRSLLRLIAETVVKLGIRTHRAEITVVRTARALAALDGRERVSLDDVKRAMELALPHRLRSHPFENPEQKLQKLLQQLDQLHVEDKPEPQGSRSAEAGAQHGGEQVAASGTGGGGNSGGEPGGGAEIGGGGASSSMRPLARLGDVNAEPQASLFPMSPPSRLGGKRRSLGHGRRSYRLRPGAQGYPVDSMPPLRGLEAWDVDLYATLRAALQRGAAKPTHWDVRVRLRREKPQSLHIILLDASGSMYAENRLAAAKAIAEGLARSSYVERAWPALIAFQGSSAQTIVQPTRSYRRLIEAIDGIAVGGSTPLPAALLEAARLARLFRLKRPGARIVLHLVTDGRANVPLSDSIEDDLVALAAELRRLGVEAVIYDTKSAKSMRLLDYTGLLARLLKARVVSAG
ncbi:putative magnesium chelatase [Pyrodictium delaneyi]|uniref:Putative magnesium chelatase n=1 Tax=Pyrodictium delaneyi TaxID=1273541 RepID=A0A0P0N5B8_9CREN|nr:ATP-binding protein [Pyrodictium delaneyi]ALL01462.1 putative magnesium chelatase [Pyrodictium delaneyi]